MSWKQDSLAEPDGAMSRMMRHACRKRSERELIVVTNLESGVVKWYDSEKGYGFIERDHGGEVYVHYSAINCEESDCTLESGVKVKFSIVQGPRGFQAQDVIVMN